MIGETLKRMKVGEPRTFAGLTVYPLTGDAGGAPGYTILDDALTKTHEEFSELR